MLQQLRRLKLNHLMNSVKVSKSKQLLVKKMVPKHQKRKRKEKESQGKIRNRTLKIFKQIKLKQTLYLKLKLLLRSLRSLLKRRSHLKANQSLLKLRRLQSQYLHSNSMMPTASKFSLYSRCSLIKKKS